MGVVAAKRPVKAVIRCNSKIWRSTNSQVADEMDVRCRYKMNDVFQKIQWISVDR